LQTNLIYRDGSDGEKREVKRRCEYYENRHEPKCYINDFNYVISCNRVEKVCEKISMGKRFLGL